MPEGDDEMGDHLMTKWCAKEGVCCFQNRLVGVATVIPTLHARPLYPYMGKVVIGCLPRVLEVPRVVDDTEVPRI